MTPEGVRKEGLVMKPMLTGLRGIKGSLMFLHCRLPSCFFILNVSQPVSKQQDVLKNDVAPIDVRGHQGGKVLKDVLIHSLRRSCGRQA